MLKSDKRNKKRKPKRKGWCERLQNVKPERGRTGKLKGSESRQKRRLKGKELKLSVKRLKEWPWWP